MPQLLVVIGAVLVLAGLAGIAAGAPSWAIGLGLGSTLIQSGTISFVGGLILIGLALVLRALRELTDRLDTINVPYEQPRTMASEPEVFRSLRPTPTERRFSPPREEPSYEETAPERMPEPPAARERRREVAPPEPSPVRERRREASPEPIPTAHVQRRMRPSPEPPAESNPAGAAVVRSGIIGGMAYTLYADGSIEAELPMGTVRFASLAELQEHVNRTGAEADKEFRGPAQPPPS